jgi:hypothetical protein
MTLAQNGFRVEQHKYVFNQQVSYADQVAEKTSTPSISASVASDRADQVWTIQPASV